MGRFYVYQYLRENGTPYYIGKGCGKRDIQKHVLSNGANITPSDRARIRRVKENLTEPVALAMEEKLIREYGRKQDGGILINTRSGGKANSGQVFNAEAKEKMRQAKLGKTRTAESKKLQSASCKKFWETFDSTERDRRISDTLKGRVIGCNKKKSIAAKKRYRAPVSCLACRKQGKMPTMVSHFNKCENTAKN